MGMFSSIMEKLGFGGAKPVTPAPPQAPVAPVAAAPVVAAPAAPVAIPVVDVVTRLENLAAAHKEKLNWKVSIVDLMKLLGLDSSFSARKEMAIELGCPAEKMGDSAQMNMWLQQDGAAETGRQRGEYPEGIAGLVPADQALVAA